MKFILTALLLIVTVTKGNIVIEEPSILPPPSQSHALGYAAELFPPPGRRDGTHSEVSERSKIVQVTKSPTPNTVQFSLEKIRDKELMVSNSITDHSHRIQKRVASPRRWRSRGRYPAPRPRSSDGAYGRWLQIG